MNGLKAVFRPGWYVRPFTNWLYPRLSRLPLGPRWVASPLRVLLSALIACMASLLLLIAVGLIFDVLGWTGNDAPRIVPGVNTLLVINVLVAPVFVGAQTWTRNAREGKPYAGDLKIKTVTEAEYIAEMERWEERISALNGRIYEWRQQLADHSRIVREGIRRNEPGHIPNTPTNIPACVAEGRDSEPWQKCRSPHSCQVHSLLLQQEMDDARCQIIDNVIDRNVVRPPLDKSFPPMPLADKAVLGIAGLLIRVVPWGIGLIATWLLVASVLDARLIGIADDTILDPGAESSTSSMAIRAVLMFLIVGSPFLAATVFALIERHRRRQHGRRGSFLLGLAGTLSLWIAMTIVIQVLAVLPALAEGRSSSFFFDPPEFSWWRLVLMVASASFIAFLSENRWQDHQEDTATYSMMHAVHPSPDSGEAQA